MTPREIESIAAVLSHVEHISRDEARRLVVEAIERGEAFLDLPTLEAPLPPSAP